MPKSTPIFSHKGVDIYACWKDEEPLLYWYALVPNHNEGDAGGFHVTELPEKYSKGLDLNCLDTWRAPHIEAITNALEDGFDLTTIEHDKDDH